MLDEVHADLVRPAGTDSDLQVRVSLEPLEDGPPGQSRSTVTSSCRHADSADRVSLDGCLYPSRVGSSDTLDEREVGFRHLTRSELRRERLMRCVVARDHDDAAGFPVETMDDAGPVIAADIRKLAEAMQKGVHQRSRVLSRPGVHGHARRVYSPRSGRHRYRECRAAGLPVPHAATEAIVGRR